MPKFVFSCHVPAIIDIPIVADSREKAEEIFQEKLNKHEIQYTNNDIEVKDLDLFYEYWVYDENGNLLEE